MRTGEGKGVETIGETYDIGDVVGHFELAICTGPFGMDNAFWDSLAVEVCEKVYEMKVLKQQRPIASYSIRGFWVGYWASIGCRVYSSHCCEVR